MGSKGIRLIVGAAIAGALLLLYGYVLFEAIQHARGKAELPSDGAFWILTTVGALVSALVTAQLAVTDRSGQAGPTRLLALGDVPTEKWATIIALVYLGVWLVLGFAAVVFGLVGNTRPTAEVVQLATFAKAWIGLAMAAAYAYFGIKPPGA